FTVFSYFIGNDRFNNCTHIPTYLLKFTTIPSTEPSVNTNELAFKIPEVFNSEEVTTEALFKLRDDKYTFLFDSPNTNNDFLLSNPKAFNTLMKFLVFGVSKVMSSITNKLDSCALIVNADLRVKRFNAMFNLKE